MRGAAEWRDRSRLLRFFGDHEHCGMGFEFHRPAGAGDELSVRCKGCGAEMEYSAAAQAGVAGAPQAPEDEDGASLESGPDRAAPRPPPPPRSPKLPRREPPAPLPPAAAVEAVGSGRPGRSRRGTRSNLITAGLVLLAGACAVFAVVRLNGSRENAVPTPSAQAPTPTAPPPVAKPPAAAETTTPPETTTPGETTPATSAPSRAHKAPRPARAPAKRQAVAAGGPTIAVPDGWSRSSSSDGAIVFEPRGGDGVAVRIYYQRSSGLSPEEMRKLARSVLERAHTGARIETAPPLAGASQRGWVAIYGGGREQAQGLFQRDLGVLLLVRTDKTAAARQRAAAIAAAMSLRLS